MAENETLDATSSPRWQRVCRAFRQGDDETQMTRRIQRTLYGFVRSSIKELAERGVSLNDILQAATSCPRDLPELLRRSREHPFAGIIADNAEAGVDRQELLNATLTDLLDRLSDQFSEEVVGRCGDWRNYDDFHKFLDHVREGLQGDVERIASRLAADPEWRVCAPRRRPVTAQVEAPLFEGQSEEPLASRGDPVTEATRSLLGESLLDGRHEQ